MKSRLFSCLLLVLLLLQVQVFSQESVSGGRREPSELSPEQLYSLSVLSPLEVPERYKGKDAPALPWWIDNSTQPYFRPITKQQGFECGQNAGISFNFTYEIDRLRGLPADAIINQYPSHFTWDFLNKGDKYGGASCFDSWEIVRRCGNMNVADYGGELWTGGNTRWISGYDAYYHGMFNRINAMHSIRVDTPEGLQTLKYWLTDHLEGSAIGGIANLYGTYFHPTEFLPEGTQEGGKYVEATWGPIATHTFTVVGYNDSIRYDYNGDGLYTNNLDITNDGVVDMRDWEIGGLKLASGFDGPGWSNGGFIYTMYKCLADNIGYGGIWNHSVYVIDVKQTCEPKLTARVLLKHTSRNKLRITMGISTDPQDTIPSYILEFPIFNFQGGDFYMQGDTTEVAKTIEFGLDLSPLINEIENDQETLFFLQVEEKDPQGTAEGEIIHYSLIDYTNGSPQTIECPQTNIALGNNSVTRLRVSHSITLDRPVITTDSLPEATISVPYSYQLSATGGTPPYRWDAIMKYSPHLQAETYPAPEGQQLSLTDNNTGYSVVDLPFTFHFYDRLINKIYVYADGYLAFDDQPFSWPFLIDRMLLYRYSALICPFMADLDLYPSNGDGIWYKTDDAGVAFWWKASVRNQSGSSNLNFAVRIDKNGTITFYYGTMFFPSGLSWLGGLSAGDNEHYQFSLLNGAPTIQKDNMEYMYLESLPAGMKITEDGLLTGILKDVWEGNHLHFRVTDNNNISADKTLTFQVPHLPLSCELNIYGDTLFYGEDANLMLKVTNESLTQLSGLSCRLRCTDPYCTITDSTAVIFNISYYETVSLPFAFSMHIESAVPDDHVILLELEIFKGNQKYIKTFARTVSSPKIITEAVSLSDNDNGRLDPGERAQMTVTFRNKGGAELQDAVAVIHPVGQDLVFQDTITALGNLLPDSSGSAVFNIAAQKSLPFDHIYAFESTITGSKGIEIHDTSYLFSGNVSEDFESGNLRKFDWKLGGNGKFHTDTVMKHEGRFCAKTGWVVGGQSSAILINANVLSAGDIRFFMKVSCEYDPSGNSSYDYFAFYIDEMEMGRWDGEADWSEKIFPVEKGYHQFRWIYQKDFSYNTGSDCAWLDDIVFPPMNHSFPEIRAFPASVSLELSRGEILQDTIVLFNSGYERLNYSVLVYDTLAIAKNLRKTFETDSSFFKCVTDGIIPGQPFTWTFRLFNNDKQNASIHTVRIDLCDEMQLTYISDFTGSTLGNLVYQGTGSDTASISWFGMTEWGAGILQPGENASATVSGIMGNRMTNDPFLIYSILFDSVSGIARHETGLLKLKNRALPNAWLSITPCNGSILRGDRDTLILTVDSRELSDGTYTCSILLKDNVNNKSFIPVTVHVIDTVESKGQNNRGTILLRSYPNPFINVVNIEYKNPGPGYVQACVYDIFGKKIRTLISEMIPEGTFSLAWDRRTDNGVIVEPGIYYCTLQAGDKTETVKLILIR
jgi:hypothetical protein